MSIFTFTLAVASCLCLDPGKMHRALVLSHRQWPVACAWTLVKCLLIRYSPKANNKSAPRLHSCSKLVRSTCKSFCVPPFTLLIASYNSVYYNYLTVTQWLVGWFGEQGKKGVCISKKVQCGPMVVTIFRENGTHFLGNI